MKENDNEKVICEKCGAEMAYYMKAGSCGFSCPNCGWGWAATYRSPLDLDEQKYTVTVENSNEGDSQKYKTISEILGCNYLEARKNSFPDSRSQRSRQRRLCPF